MSFLLLNLVKNKREIPITNIPTKKRNKEGNNLTMLISTMIFCVINSAYKNFSNNNKEYNYKNNKMIFFIKDAVAKKKY